MIRPLGAGKVKNGGTIFLLIKYPIVEDTLMTSFLNKWYLTVQNTTFLRFSTVFLFLRKKTNLLCLLIDNPRNLSQKLN
jgi:hypothetical protein